MNLRTSAFVFALVCLWVGLGCSKGDRAPGPDQPGDSGPPFDWTLEALPPPVVGCGDTRVDPGESCDDGNDDDADGCMQCRWPSLCGNGVLEAGEACDDGNRTNGDGCRASCALEVCGDGYVDVPTEACEGDADGCAACAAPAACGDGLVGEGERCDDGNGDDWDGCTAVCTDEQVFVISEIGFATDTARACDVTGTGVRQNAIGQAFAVTSVAWNAYIASQLRDISRRPAIGISGWPRGMPAPATFRMAAFDVLVVDPLTRTIARSELGFDHAHGHLEGLELVSALADLRLQMGGAIVVEEPFRRAQLRLRASPDVAAPQRVEGVLCGVPEVRSLARAEDTLGSGTANPLPPCAPLTRIVSLADIIAGGRSLGFIPTQPDVDLDGDGLEQLVVAGRPDDTCTPVIVGCVEGDGTVTEDPNCVFDFDDGWSASISLVADRATFEVGP